MVVIPITCSKVCSEANCKVCMYELPARTYSSVTRCEVCIVAVPMSCSSASWTAVFEAISVVEEMVKGTSAMSVVAGSGGGMPCKSAVISGAC